MPTCLACLSENTKIILDFGLQPAANLLPDSPNAFVKRVPLALRICENCGHAQQDQFYPPEELFGNYLYQSGTTRTLNKYFEWLAGKISQNCEPSDHVFEIASNDGSFLSALKLHGLDCSGVEPASNLVSISRDRGLDVHHAFWPDLQLNKKISRIVAMNVLAHVPDPHRFLSAVKDCMSANGIAYIQVSQADMFVNYEFDTLYHEHFSFFCPSSLAELGRRCGFTKIQFCKTAVHGNSILALFGFDDSPIEDALSNLVDGEFALGSLSSSDRPTRLEAECFQNFARQTCASILSFEKLARQSGRKFVLVGAAAKAITVCQVSGAKFDDVIDEAPLKVGRYVPGGDVKISSFVDASKETVPCLFVIGAWNFRKEIENKLRCLRRNHTEDLVVVYFPTLSVGSLHGMETF
ncbi:class I SAM-dependent methyltransferase [Methylobacterium sp. E-066]|uniref:class I SAM-dependent methyltransferase n=1 Tax=Methylobacterium sp. E-066 TaxID=2836584 RepID=UPI001FBC0732|nr:class I SAM-dependent methyltransferase [Methylobacterium sp. E-066]MCJ2143455.1 class I SAM-dependent methyltransferase [Methylobacterium sp. E-066]